MELCKIETLTPDGDSTSTVFALRVAGVYLKEFDTFYELMKFVGDYGPENSPSDRLSPPSV